VCRELTERFEFLAVAITLRESISASQNNWSAVLYTGGEMFRSKKHSITVIDRNRRRRQLYRGTYICYP
jgi:2-dehydro-3-deoxygluconokinase